MTRAPVPPPSFVARGGPEGVWLVAREGHAAALERSGMNTVAAWERWAVCDAVREGRGVALRAELAGLPPLRLKRMRRGGWAGPLWRDRFAGTRRLLDNLRVADAARALGVPTPEPVALLLAEGPPALFRGWLALVDVPDAQSLAAGLLSDSPPGAEELRAAARTVRAMHDRGLDHRDLNLGNLLLRQAPGREPEVLVIDLDGARLYAAPLPLRARRRALARLERSSVKLLGPAGRVDGLDLRRLWYEAYAGADESLARTLDRERRRNRLRIALHKLAWRR